MVDAVPVLRLPEEEEHYGEEDRCSEPCGTTENEAE